MNERTSSSVLRWNASPNPSAGRTRNAAFLFALLALLLVPCTGNATIVTPEEPTIAFAGSAIVVSGVTPNAQVIIFGIERSVRGYGWFTRNVTVAVQSDANGVASHDLQRTVSPRSIYTAVDFETGQYGIATPEGTVLKRQPGIALRMNDSLADGQTAFETFDFDRQWIQAICVRPGEGAWRMALFDGAPIDANAAIGTVQMAAPAMRAISGSESAPVTFQPQDVLIVIDPYELDVVATRVNP